MAVSATGITNHLSRMQAVGEKESFGCNGTKQWDHF